MTKPQFVLIVDDSEDDRLVLRGILSSLDAEIIEADSGAVALTKIPEQGLALAIIDVRMPGMSGFELARSLRESQGTSHLPIIFMTAYNTDEFDRIEGYAAGGIDYLFKPCPAEILLSKVHFLLDLAREKVQLREDRDSLEQTVAQRTAELDQRVRELECLYAVYRLLALSTGDLGVTLSAVVAQLQQGCRETTAPVSVRLTLLGQEFLSSDFSLGNCTHSEEIFAEGESIGRLELFCHAQQSPEVDSCPGLAQELIHSLAERLGIFAEKLRRQTKLNELNQALLHSNRELEQFAYVISHDLQEPLRMVASYVRLLAKRYHGQLDPAADDFINFAVDGATRMQRMIKDLLELSRVATRNNPPEEVNCTEVVQDVMQDLALAIEDSGATIQADPLPRVWADRSQLNQVFRNLLGNAIKFHGAAPPVIELQAQREGKDWLFTISDNGIGIDPRQFERIFVVFQRLHTRDQYPGTGMGLAIVKRIIERHKGRIWVKSQPGAGARFCFTLPAAE